MNYNDYLQQIISFNGDKDIIALREKFNRPSFFEIISKERSETTYSSFLKWLFQENCMDKETCNPLALLLDVLVRRSEEQKGYVDTVLNNQKVKQAIVTRAINIKSVNIETEKYVSHLTQLILNLLLPSSSYKVKGELLQDDLKKIAAKSKDRIDLFVDCSIDLEGVELNAKRIQIVIENKIDSVEGKGKRNEKTGVDAYDNATQTKRYFLGTNMIAIDGNGKTLDVDAAEILQIYVYLTPQEPSEGACDEHFIQISYQDIVDSILVPMLASSSSLSQRSHFYIDEFLNQLVFPSLDGTMVHPSIAIGKENSAELTKMWKNYQPLLTDAAIAASEMTFWMIGETYYDHFPKVELLEVLPKDVQSDIIQDGNWKKGTRNNKIIDLANKNGIITQQVNLVIDDEAQELLTLFWENNKRLLAAVINGLETQERKKVSALLNQASKRDTTKYNVYFEGTALNIEPLGKAMTAFCIVKKWVDIQKEQGKNVTLTELNDAFPRKCNPYYERGQWYNHLFYEVADNYFFDGENAEGEVQGNWDFDKKGRFNINLTGGQKVTMLKMWRKDALETLIEWTEKKKLFNGLLNVVPV